ncbi:MAG: VOC family protein [Sphingobium sp.]
MYTHVMVGADDIARSKSFYDAIFAELSIAPGNMDALGRAVYLTQQGMFVVTRPIDGGPATSANGGTIGFAAASPEAIDDWHSAGLAHGGTTCEDPPGWRASEFGDLYAAYLRDPAGNKICALYMGGR